MRPVIKPSCPRPRKFLNPEARILAISAVIKLWVCSQASHRRNDLLGCKPAFWWSLPECPPRNRVVASVLLTHTIILMVHMPEKIITPMVRKQPFCN